LVVRNAEPVRFLLTHGGEAHGGTGCVYEGGCAAEGSGVARDATLAEVVHKQDAAIGSLGDLAPFGGGKVYLLVPVFLDPVRLDERVNDQKPDVAAFQLVDQLLDHGKCDGVAGLVGLHHYQGPVASAVQEQPALQGGRVNFVVLDGRSEAAEQFVSRVLKVVAP